MVDHNTSSKTTPARFPNWFSHSHTFPNRKEPAARHIQCLRATLNHEDSTLKVWLDDERDPDNIKIQELFGAEPGMIWCKTADAAINRLKSNSVEWISLDHDLGTTSTGYDVAKWIEERAHSGELFPLVWTVHSANVIGARAMRQALENADRFWGR